MGGGVSCGNNFDGDNSYDCMRNAQSRGEVLYISGALFLHFGDVFLVKISKMQSLKWKSMH